MSISAASKFWPAPFRAPYRPDAVTDDDHAGLLLAQGEPDICAGDDGGLTPSCFPGYIFLTLTARYIGELDLHPGDKVSLIPDPARIHRFDDSGKSIHA